jgi:hypothetical protein
MPELYPCNPLIVNAFLGGLRRASRPRAVALGVSRENTTFLNEINDLRVARDLGLFFGRAGVGCPCAAAAAGGAICGG